jgi:hypothetical protein
MPGLSLHFTAWSAFKALIGLILSLLGAFYIRLGKNEGEPEKLFIGLALILASIFLF